LFTQVKKNSEDISSDDDNNSDLDRTPRNKSPIEEGYRTPTQRDYEEISDLKRSLKNINRLIENNTPEKSDNNQPINPKDAEDLTNLEEEYSYFFDKDSGNKTKREALNEIKDKIEGELGVFSETSLAGLSDALKEISPEPANNKVIEEQTERANTPKTSENAMPASNTQPLPPSLQLWILCLQIKKTLLQDLLLNQMIMIPQVKLLQSGWMRMSTLIRRGLFLIRMIEYKI
jgi:hypothetical protein